MFYLSMAFTVTDLIMCIQYFMDAYNLCAWIITEEQFVNKTNFKQSQILYKDPVLKRVDEVEPTGC